MHKSTLREIAKFTSGLIFGDFLCGLWFYVAGYLPITFFSITFDEKIVVAWLVFDVLLFIFLVHYAWHTTGRSRTSAERKFHLAAGTLFTIVALLHLSRIVFGVDFVIGSWSAPYWLNALGAVTTTFLAYASFSLAHKEK